MTVITITSADAARGSLILINPDHPVRHEPAREELQPVGPGVLLEQQAAAMLNEVFARLGVTDEIVPVSGYRPLAEQQRLYDEAVRDHGQAFTDKYVARPGCSEHQTGLAIDLAANTGRIDPIRPSFPYDGMCQRFREEALRYGFVERYPAGRQHITRIAHEPWHFRYVGHPHALLMHDRGLTLEEYTDYVKLFRYGERHWRTACDGQSFELFYVPVDSADPVTVEIPPHVPYSTSGNNAGGVVVTLGPMGDG